MSDKEDLVPEVEPKTSVSKDTGDQMDHVEEKLRQQDPSLPRRSSREKKQTPKVLEGHEKAIQTQSLKFQASYLKWKHEAKTSRTQLKGYVPKEDGSLQLKTIASCKSSVEGKYGDLCKLRPPTKEETQRMDRVQQVTRDLSQLLEEAISTLKEDFNPTTALFNTRAVLNKKELPSIFGDTITESECSLPTHHSSARESVHSRSSTAVSSKCDAAAELAVKRVQLRALHEIQAQQRKVKAEEERLELVKAQTEVDMAAAVVDAYSSEDHSEEESSQVPMSAYPFRPMTHSRLDPAAPRFVPQVSETSRPVQTDMSSMLHAFQEGISLGRLPVPEPPVFSGNPLQFPEWKNSFCALIDRKNIGAADKLFYLRKYLSGPAAKVIQGVFLRTDQGAYNDAWDKLNARYGDPFLIQRAFRERLARWPRVADRDGKGLREFSDFLVSCNDAIPHVKGLEILNDWEENQKIAVKLPSWVNRRWNRKVTMALKAHSFPTFAEFCNFVVEEADVACNPATLPLATQEESSNAPRKRVMATSASPAPEPNPTLPSCPCCKGSHSIYRCSEFEAKTLNDRKVIVKEQRLCFGCLRRGHQSKDCRRRSTCGRCKRNHPTLLHQENTPAASPTPAPPDSSESGPTPVTSCCISSDNQSTSMIVPVWVASSADPSHEILTYALLDTQGDASFMLDSLANSLGLNGDSVRLKIVTMTSTSEVFDSTLVSGVNVRSFSGDKVISLDKTYTREFVPGDRKSIPTSDTARQWPHLKQIAQEIPALQDCEIGLLIGYNCPVALLPREIIAGDDQQPFAIKTDLGWSIVGGEASTAHISVCHKTRTREVPVVPKDVLNVLEKDFTSEPAGTVSQEDIQFLKVLDKGTRQEESGHLEMPLPFKSRPCLPVNKSLALARLNHLKRKLMKDAKYQHDYKTFMQDIIDHGEAEEAQCPGVEGETWYIPHHGVYHPRKPDKIRVVFDCSSRYAGTALNDHLLSGPELTNALVGVLCRFRKYPVAIACDIERMFHQFSVRPDDRDFLRFLWWPNGDLNQNPVEYRMKVHLFGATSSPGCANYGLKFLADKYKGDFPNASVFIRDQFYVDDGLASVSTASEAIQLVKEARGLCEKGGLHLHKFISNDRDVLESVPAEERAVSVKSVDMNKEELPVSSTLGIQWNVEEDKFFFLMKKKDIALTRREILSVVSSIYDPLGFLAPFILPGKMLLQHMCRTGTGWDDPLSPELKPQWDRWVSDFEIIATLRISRCLMPPGFGTLAKMELHHFSDASNAGYGQCSYMRMQDQDERVHCALVMAKARVAPTKITTTPRLELAAAVVSVKISHVLKQEFCLENVREFFWTDSQVVLGYICNEARRFHTFVANRVQMIRENSSPDQWCYVDTQNNPADLASRGASASELMASNWLKGPEFLWDPQLVCKPWNSTSLSLEDPEVRKIRVFKTTTKSTKLVDKLARFSSWTRLVRAIARLKRRAKGTKGAHCSTLQEKEEASRFLVLLAQQEPGESYLKEWKDLSPFKDEDGTWRVGGRMRHSQLPFEAKHPAIVPGRSHLAQLLITHFHAKIGHQGRGMTQNEVRANGYWIVSGSAVVSSIIHRCVTCRRKRSKLQEQIMSDLPEDRVEPSPPFSFCGMDCFGPFMTKNGRKENKRWGLLFTCLCSRAIHIEMLDDMSTDAFINALRCFVSIRGKVRQIRSDQGSNFVGAKNELRNALKEVDMKRVQHYLSNQDCEFVLNPPSSSHRGGVWERQIRTARAAIQGVCQMCPGRLDDSSLRTVFYEAMAIVNSRPLTVDTINSPNSPEPLTPNHILTMKSSVPLPPPGKFLPQDMYLRKRWRRVQYLVEQFWCRWKKEYLQGLNKRRCWTTKRRNVIKGDIVILAEPDTPRNEWPLGLVVEATSGRDKLVRKVKVRITTKQGNTSVLERPIQKIAVLVEADSPEQPRAVPVEE